MRSTEPGPATSGSSRHEARSSKRTRPFGVVAEALGCRESSADPELAKVGRLLSSHVRSDGGPVTVTSDPGLQFRVVDAFVDLVEALAIRGPVVIGIDDLQWADPSSLMTLGAWSRRLAHLPVALIGCLRPAPRTPQLQRLLDALTGDRAGRIGLGPLGDDAVAALVAEAVDAPPSARLLSEIGGAGGNPFFITELLAAISEEGSLVALDGLADVTHVTAAPDPAADDPATAGLPVRGDDAGAPGGDDPREQLQPGRPLHHHDGQRPGAVGGPSRSDPGPRPGRRGRAGCGSATTSSGTRSTTTSRGASAWPCTARPVVGWPSAGHPCARWPSSSPGVPSPGTGRRSPGSRRPPRKPRSGHPTSPSTSSTGSSS